jgi:AraC-like DNA-binding protein
MREHVLHGEPDDAFFWAVGAPDPRLGAYVRSYGDFHERSAAPLMRREIASGELVVIVDFGDGWTVGQGETAPTHMGSFAGGLHDGPALAGHAGRARCMQIDLTPLGMRALLGVPASELSHRVVALEDLLGAEAARMADALEAAGTWAARFAALDALLLRRAAETPALRPDVSWAWRRLTESAGAVRVHTLTRELGCSRRHLATRFRHEIGLTPKAYARVLRFQRAAELLTADGGGDLGDVALACGYADQPHFNREFRALAGTTPREYLAARMGVAGVVA